MAATINELKDMVIELRMDKIKAQIPSRDCPYAYTSRKNPLNGCDEGCSRCREVFLDSVRKDIREEVDNEALMIKDLKEMIVEIKMDTAKAIIPGADCPYAYSSRKNPLDGCDAGCSTCKDVFFENMQKDIQKEVESL